MNNNQLNTPILFLIFNRPDTTKIVFDRIREIKPKYLYIAADGPRENRQGEELVCKATREYVLDSIDWDCEFKTLFRDKNLGCGSAVSSAITWFFENVEMGIILEDDILADLSFFHYCDVLLNKYRDDTRIMHISGLNIKTKWNIADGSYFFSKLGTIWGWATWRRAWVHYDFNISIWQYPEMQAKILSLFPEKVRKDRKKLYDDLFSNKIDTWDYQWTFSRIIQSGLSIIPKTNLIKNIGCGYTGTHTQKKHPWSDLEVIPLPLILKHTQFIIHDVDYDLYHLGIKR
jgi:hypothetical protein